MIWLFSCFFHKGFPISKDQCVQMAKEKTKPWLYPNPMRKGAGRAPMVGQVKPWRDWPKKVKPSPKSGCFFSVGFFFHFVAMTDQPVLFGAFVSGFFVWWNLGKKGSIWTLQKAVHIFDQRTGQDQLHDLSNTLPVPGRRHNLSIVFLAMVSQEAKTGEIFTK